MPGWVPPMNGINKNKRKLSLQRNPRESRNPESEEMMDVRLFPEQEKRVETGPIQFGDDWPGIFIRGDNAFGMVMALRSYIAAPDSPLGQIGIKGVIRRLLSANVHKDISDKIEAELVQIGQKARR